MLTNLAQVNEQIQKYWAPIFTQELREQLLLGALVNKSYQGDLKQGGDTVYVSQLTATTGELKTIGVDADTFSSEAVSMSRVAIVADRRAVASYKVADLVSLQSQLSEGKPEILESLRFAVAKKMNDYLYSLVSPSASAPDHIINSISTFGLSTLQTLHQAVNEAKWPQDGQWYGLMSPKYYADLLGVTAATSTDFGATDAAVISGQIALKRFGFSILGDNSRSGSQALFFHPSFMHMVMQSQVQLKVSDLHSQNQFGYVVSADVVFGAVQAIDGNIRCIKVIST